MDIKSNKLLIFFFTRFEQYLKALIYACFFKAVKILFLSDVKIFLYLIKLNLASSLNFPNSLIILFFPNEIECFFLGESECGASSLFSLLLFTLIFTLVLLVVLSVLLFLLSVLSFEFTSLLFSMTFGQFLTWMLEILLILNSLLFLFFCVLYYQL